MQRVLALMKRALLIGIAATLLGIIGTTANAEDAAGKLKIETDGSQNPDQLGIFVNQSKNALPAVLKVLTPTGNAVQRAGQGQELNAANAGAVESIVAALMAASQAQGTAGKAIWTLAISLTILGVAINGFITFGKVAQGKIGPGEGLTS